MPAFLGSMMPVIVCPLLGIDRYDVPIGWRFLAIMAALPAFLAGIIGAPIARQDAWSKYAMGPLLATRPLTSGALVKVKFQMCAVSAVCTWLIALVGALFLLLRPGLANSMVEAAATMG